MSGRHCCYESAEGSITAMEGEEGSCSGCSKRWRGSLQT